MCSLIDCQKLSREACAHAAQNDRLPVQTVVHVLYYEQQGLREAMNGNGESNSPRATIDSNKTLNIYPTDASSLAELAKLRKENEDLKIELLKLKMKLKEAAKATSNNKSVNSSSPAVSSISMSTNADKPPLPHKSFIQSVKKLGRLLLPVDGLTPPTKRTKPPRDRCHSFAWNSSLAAFLALITCNFFW